MKSVLATLLMLASLALAQVPNAPSRNPYCGRSRDMYHYNLPSDGTPNCDQCRDWNHYPRYFKYFQCSTPGTMPYVDHFTCDIKNGLCVTYVSFNVDFALFVFHTRGWTMGECWMLECWLTSRSISVVGRWRVVMGWGGCCESPCMFK